MKKEGSETAALRLEGNLSTRNHIFHDITRGLCPRCAGLVDAQILIRDGAVFMRKRCPEHGWSEALVSSDSKWHLDSMKYNKPGAVPLKFAEEVKRGCPYDCGLCPEHQQHTCLAIIEVTTRCNLSCGTCFADAGCGYDLGLDQVERMLDGLMESEGRPEVVQISGGEPTLHPHIADIVAAVKARGIRYVMLNTNGLRLAEEADFARRLAEHDPTVYLQFDGLSAGTYERLRGRDLRDVKRRALDKIAEAGLDAVLVDTVVRGVNEGEIGDVLRFGIDHPAVLGVSDQPATFAGRSPSGENPLDRVTLACVLKAIEEQTSGLFRVDDFRPVPCPHPTCSACTYAFVDGDHVTPVTRLLNVDDYLDFLTNRVVPDLSDELRSVLEGLWSMGAVIGTGGTTERLSCCALGADFRLPSDLEELRRSFFMVQAHAFMDLHTFDLRRLMKCCIHQLTPDGRAIPFCAYNNLGYRERVKLMMGDADGREAERRL